MKKLYLGCFFSFYSFYIFAADLTGISQLDTPIRTGQTILKVAAKWGGIGLLVAAGVMFGLGKMKGEAIGAGFYLLIGLGIISAAFGWWDTAFTSGFAF